MLSKLTLIGLDTYSDGAIWKDLKLPEGIDKELLVHEILRQGGEFSVLYPDQEFLTLMITAWGKKWYHNFERWVTAYEFDYNALFNLDVTSTTTEVGNNSESGESHSNGTSGNTHSKAAYDSNGLQPASGDNGSNSINTNSSGSSNHTITTTEVRQGNQGITMSQELVLAEFNAWRFNLYSQIADIFINEFCIAVYM